MNSCTLHYYCYNVFIKKEGEDAYLEQVQHVQRLIDA